MGTIVRGKLLRADQANWDGVTKTSTRVDATGGTITGLTFGESVDVLQVYGSGTDRTRATILNATNTIGSADRTLVFSVGTWTIDDDLTIPANFTCHVPAGCVFSVASGKTLTFSGEVVTEADTFASGSGSVSTKGGLHGARYLRTAAEISAGVTPVDYRYPEGDIRRYGATTSAAATTAIQSAVSAAREIYIPEGTYTSGQVTITSGPKRIYGPGTIKLEDSSAITAPEGLFQVTGDDVTFEDIAIDGNQANQTGTDEPHLIVFEEAARGIVRRVKFANARGACVLGRNADACRIEDCRIVDGVSYGIIFGMQINNGDVNLIGPVISGNYIDNSANTGRGAIIMHSGLDGSGDGQSAFYVGARVTKNVIYLERSSGTFHECMDIRGKGFHVEGNFTDGGGIGCSAKHGEGSTVANNTHVAPEKFGLEITTDEGIAVSNVTVQGEDITETGIIASGLSQVGGSISGCVVTGCQFPLHLTNATDYSVSGCYLKARSDSTELIRLTDCEGVCISGSNLVGDSSTNTGVLLLVDDATSDTITMSGNRVTGTTNALRASAASATAFDNIALAGNIFDTSGAALALISSATWGTGIKARGNVGLDDFDGGAPAANETYTATNVSTDRSYDADTVVVAELADVVGTLIADLRSKGAVD